MGLLSKALLLCLLVGWSQECEARPIECSDPRISGEYDGELQLAARRYMPRPYNWCLLKAQCYVESGLDTGAVSPVGAVGLCQLTAGAWVDTGGQRYDLRQRYTAKRNTESAAKYLGILATFWSTPRDADCRWELMAASYNAGAGNILKAQALSGGRLCWDLIQAELPQVTGEHSRETQAYVLRIWAAYRKLRGFGF